MGLGWYNKEDELQFIGESKSLPLGEGAPVRTLGRMRVNQEGGQKKSW